MPRFEGGPGGTTKVEKAEREIELRLKEFEALCTAFETEHDVEVLHAITHLVPQEAAHHPVRDPARLALYPIVSLLQFFEEQHTDISDEQYAVLHAKYMKCSRAVGIINKNVVDHTRTGNPQRMQRE